MGYAAVALLALTGAVNSVLLVGSPGALIGTPYGRLLALKIKRVRRLKQVSRHTEIEDQLKQEKRGRGRDHERRHRDPARDRLSPKVHYHCKANRNGERHRIYRPCDGGPSGGRSDHQRPSPRVSSPLVAAPNSVTSGLSLPPPWKVRPRSRCLAATFF